MDVQQLFERLEIVGVLVRCTRSIDAGDWDRLDVMFTPDAQIDYTQSGGLAGSYADVKPWLAENLPNFPKRMHTLGQVEVAYDEGAGDAADVAAYFHNPMMLSTGDGSETLVELGGIYPHRMVRTPGGWRSERLVEELVWKRGL